MIKEFDFRTCPKCRRLWRGTYSTWTPENDNDDPNDWRQCPWCLPDVAMWTNLISIEDELDKFVHKTRRAKEAKRAARQGNADKGKAEHV